MILKHPPTPLSRGTPSATWRRLSFSSIRSKDGLYEEIKEHLRWNEPLGVTVSLLLEPRQPTADISLCHSHHSNVISSTRSGATLTIPHAPSTCTSPVTSRINFFYDRHLSGVRGIYSVSTVHNKCFFFPFRPDGRAKNWVGHLSMNAKRKPVTLNWCIYSNACVRRSDNPVKGG